MTDEFRQNTPEEFAEIVRAIREGKMIQHRHRAHSPWNDKTTKCFYIDNDLQYRVKPEPVTTWRAWTTLAEVPLDAWFRRKNNFIYKRIDAISDQPGDKEPIYLNGVWNSFGFLLSDYVWSTSPITGPWNPCGKKETK